MQTESPSSDIEFNITAFKGIEMGLGQDDSGIVNAQRLAELYPDHLILVQVGTFLHGYDKTAHILNTLKKYKLQMVGKNEVHLRVGFPVANFKRHMFNIEKNYHTPYVAAVGCKKMGYTVFVSVHAAGEKSLMRKVPDSIVDQVISDLQQFEKLNDASTEKLLNNPNTSGFKLKQFAQDLDNQITIDLIKLPRDVRATFGESLRIVMQRIMQGVFSYGLSGNKVDVLHALSGDIDHLKHQLAQVQRLSQVKIAFEHRAGLAVELGRLVGGLIRSSKVAS